MRDPDTGWIGLSAAEFFLLWWAGGHGDAPLGLGIPHVGRTPAQRAELAERGSAALESRGLGTVYRPDGELADLLGLLATAPRRALLFVDGDRFRGLVATGRDTGAGAAVTGDEVRVGPVRTTGVVDVLTDALEPLPGGQGRPANVDWTDYLAACGAGGRGGQEAFLAVLRDAGVRLPEQHTILRATTGRTGGGTLAVTGPREATLAWVDTPDGRYVVRREGTWFTVTPADPARLVTMLRETVAV